MLAPVAANGASAEVSYVDNILPFTRSVTWVGGNGGKALRSGGTRPLMSMNGIGAELTRSPSDDHLNGLVRH